MIIYNPKIIGIRKSLQFCEAYVEGQIGFVTITHPSVHPHGTNRFPRDGYDWNPT